MAITLAQASNFTQDKLAQMVIDEFRQDQLMELMLFDDCVSPQGSGSTLSYVYNRVKTLPTAQFRNLNNEYVASEADTEQQTVNLKIFGGSFNVDRVIQNHVKGINTDQIQFQLQQKIKAARALFSDTLINGDSAVDAKAFDGLDKAITGSTTEIVPAAALDLSTAAMVDANWKAFLYQLRIWRARLDAAPSFYLVNRDMFAVFQAVADFSTQFNQTKDAFGNEVVYWGLTPIIPVGDKPGTSDSIIPTSVAVGTEGETSIYAGRIGLDGVHCVSPDGGSVIETYLPNMTLPGAVKTGEVEMVTAMALKATRAAGALRKIKIA